MNFNVMILLLKKQLIINKKNAELHNSSAFILVVWINYFVTTIFFIIEKPSLLTLTKYTPEERSLVEITVD